MKNFAVIISGCGVYDGAEIHESVLTMWAIRKNGAEYTMFAPDIPQHHVINHLNGQEMNEKRNVLIESARIARGDIKNLNEFRAEDYDALIIPGGFGAAKNLCTFAFDGTECYVNPEVEKAVKQMIDARKPIGALCISPILLAKIVGDAVQLTIGKDPQTIEAIENLGAVHEETDHGDVVVDENFNVVTTPCYMLEADIVQIADGADNVVKSILELIG